MPQTIQTFLQGRDLVGLTIQGGVLGSGSAITWGTAVEMSLAATGVGTFEALEFNGNPQLQEFTPSDWSVANYQIEREDWSFTVREVSNPSNIGTMMSIALAYDYIRVNALYAPKWARATAASQTRLVAIGSRGPTSFPLTAGGKNIQQVEIRPIGFLPFVGAGSATPTI